MNTDILPAEGLILCAVSGGADSMYLLCRLGEMGYPVAAAHYNHGLRGAEAGADEAFVRSWCEKNAIPFRSEKGDVPAFAAAHRMGLEEAARACRYDFLERTADSLGAAAIATAHTANDNAETLLLRLARGTGLKGLGGIPPVRGRLVRPMLDVTRDEVEAYLRERGVPHVEDSTNAGDQAARNRVRHQAVPALESVNRAFIKAAGQTAALLREDEAYLSSLAESFIRERGRENALPAKELAALPLPVAARAVRRMAGTDLSKVHVDAVLKAARWGGAADVPGLRAARAGDWLVFRPEERPSIRPRTLSVPGETDIPEADMRVRCRILTDRTQLVHNSFNIFYFPCDNICGSITVSGRLPGDSFRPAGRGCTKTLKQLFLEKGVPAWVRDSVPVLRDEKGVLAVYGVGASERACAGTDGGRVLEIEFIRSDPDRGGMGYAP